MTTQNIAPDINRYTIISKIGEGGFSKVYRVKDIKTNKYYASKISNSMIDEDTKGSQESILLFREVNLMSLLNHPSILKFIGYYPTNFEGDPLPTIITELATNGSLRDILNMESTGFAPDDWNQTKKLINIYGIASGMAYLHLHNILHRDLKPENILIDEFLYPKISDFGLSKITDFLSNSMNFQSQRGLKGTVAYMSPEIFSDEKYSKSSDIYAFGFIVFEIMTGTLPYENMNQFTIMKKVSNGYRPTISPDVPNSYQELIKRCWSQDENERPTFNEIVNDLKNNKEFLDEIIDEAEFYDYVDYIDNYRSTFDVSKRTIHFLDFIKAKGRNKALKVFQIDNDDSGNSTISISSIDINSIQEDVEKGNDEIPIVDINKSHIDDDNTKIKEKLTENEMFDSNSLKINEMKIVECDDDSNANNLYPQFLFDQVSKENQLLLLESKENIEKQFEVSQFLISGQNGFPKNINLGLRLIIQLIHKKYFDAYLCYIRILIKGKLLPQDLTKASKYLSNVIKRKDYRVSLLKGLICRKMSKYTEAIQYFEEGIKSGECECMFQYGKMLFIGEGIKINQKESIKYFNLSEEKGFNKSKYFILSYNRLSSIKEFNKLPPETQLVFIQNNIKYQYQQQNPEFNEIILKPKITEKLFFNKSMKTSIFYKMLNQYKNVSIEIAYPSDDYKSIFNLTSKIKKKHINYLKIGVVITSFEGNFTDSILAENISYHKICTSTMDIPSDIFANSNFASEMISILPPIRRINDGAFCNCKSLTQISIPPSVVYIGNSAFRQCISLTQITIPPSVVYIGNGAFSNCISLTQITIPPSVANIGFGVFNYCPLLTQSSMPSSITKFNDCDLKKWISLSEIIISSSTTLIGRYAFYKFKSLVKITIPSSVTLIGCDAFNECSSLTQIVIPSSVTFIGCDAFFGCSSLTQITIPSSITEIRSLMFAECSSLMHIAIPTSVTSIRQNVFMNCSSLTQIEIPNSVTEIGEFAFYGCSKLAQIVIPNSVASIGSSAFKKCSSLAQIEIPSSVTEIKEFTFFGCSSLTQIVIPNSITSIGSSAFKGCSSLTQIEIPFSVTEIKEFTFFGCSSLTQIVIPNSITSIGSSAFKGCSSLTQIEIPSSVTEIKEFTFFGCSSLTQITIPSSITCIAKLAFAFCSSLTHITIPSSVTSLERFAFNNCSSLREVTIPYRLTSKFIFGSSINNDKSIEYTFPD